MPRTPLDPTARSAGAPVQAAHVCSALAECAGRSHSVGCPAASDRQRRAGANRIVGEILDRILE